MQFFSGEFDWVSHEVHTADGYILNIFHLVPWGYNSDSRDEYEWGEPVLMMHGMGESAVNWIHH